MKFILYLTILSTAFLSSCQDSTSQQNEIEEQSSDPLPSWNEGKTKSGIIKFIRTVTDPSSTDFIEIPDRIAVFDNDGTLWSEKPLYFQLLFAIDKVREMAPAHPEWKNQQPFKAILEDDIEKAASFGVKGIMDIVMTTHAGTTPAVFESDVKKWLKKARHPRFERPYSELIFQPMLELITLLKKNDFKVFIVSGGGIEFMRAWVEQVYGIPKDQVVGSSIKTEFMLKRGKPELIRLPEIDFIDDKEGKPVGINKFIGRKPIVCVGNSDGDLQMMQWTASNEEKSLMIYVHHTDSVREWAYDRESHVGRFDKGWDEAIKKGWIIVDMKDDWKNIYPFNNNNE